MTPQIRAQIKEWIRTDAKVVRLAAEIARLKQKQRQIWNQFHTRQLASHWRMYRELKRIDDFRVAIVDRRKKVHQIAQAHTRTLAGQNRELNRELAKAGTRLARALSAMGARRGFLRKDLADRFVKLAAREATRRSKV